MKPCLVFICVILSCCATHRNSQVAMMAGGLATGVLIGASSAPRDENKVTHGFLWGGLIASTLGLMSLYIFDSEKALNNAHNDIINLRKELDQVKNSQSPKLIGHGQGLFKEPIPKEMKNFVTPGEWKKYSVDQWIQEEGNPHTWFHYDLMYEFIEPNFGL